MLNPSEITSQIKTEHFVAGKRVKAFGSEKYSSLNPFDNSEVATFALADAKDVDRAVCAAREAFDKGAWASLTTAERIKILNKFADLIAKRADFLGAIESLDVGKLHSECVNHDVARASANIRFFANQMESLKEEVFYNDANFLGKKIKTMSVVRREPIGVAGLISPWNSPLMLATWKIGPCLAAGNTCVVKPSPWALLSVLQLGELANEAGIPEGVLNIIPGAAEGGKALVAHPGVNRVSFTGSVASGKAVQESNAKTRLAPVSLELGGKSPSIVFSDADLDFSAKGVARGIFRSQGQSCVAGSRLLVEESVYSKFMPKLVEQVKAMKIGNQLDPKSEIGPLITGEHLAKVESYVAQGKKEGARITIGGKRPDSAELRAGNFFEPTIFEDVSSAMKIWQEEIFGPVLVVMPFKDEAQAIELANSTSFGLSASIWSTNLERALRVANAIESGMVWVNSHFVRDLRAPFGGVKNSGVGSEGGHYSLEFYTQPKMICYPWGN